MLRSRAAIGTGRGVACIVALMLGAASAQAQSVSRQTPLTNQRAEEVQGSAQQAPARFFRISDVLAKSGTVKDASVNDPVRIAARNNDDFLSDAPLRGSIPQIGEEPFGLFAFRAPEGTLWRKWRRLEADIKEDEAVIAGCRDHALNCSAATRRFLSILDAVKVRSGHARLEEVNRQINAAIHYTSDLAQHGIPDRWSSPVAALAAGRGDCEDYAIAKYVILREAGHPAIDLRFLLVRDRLAREDHAVLAARLDGRWLILDNRFSVIPEDNRMHNFTPLFALDHEGVKLVAAPYAKVAIAADNAPKPATWLDDDSLGLRGTVKASAAETTGSGAAESD